MFNGIRIFAPPEFPVLSLEVQARLPVAEAQEQSQFRLLVRHFLERFFNNDMVSADGETKARLLQVLYAIALPGLVVALFLFPLYHQPLERPFWSQVSDHYFYVLYSFVAVGAVTIFAWDLLFPDLLDLFVLSSLPIVGARLFRSRIVAAVVFLGMFLLGSSALGALFYPPLSDPPGLARHMLAHVSAVLAAGAFAAALILSLQGFITTVMGERVSRAISPFVQGIAITATISVNKKMEKGNRHRCANDMQSKRSLPPSSFETFMVRHPSMRRCPDVRIWPTTKPLAFRGSISRCRSSSSNHASTWPGNCDESCVITPAIRTRCPPISVWFPITPASLPKSSRQAAWLKKSLAAY